MEYFSNHWLDLSKMIVLILGDQTEVKIYEMKVTSNGIRPQNIKSGISQQTLVWSFSNFKPKFEEPNGKQKLLEMKTTSNERWVPYIASEISQQPLIGSFSNFKLKFREPNRKWKLL